jgi:hypothetical protein
MQVYRMNPEIPKIFLLLHYYAGFDENYRNVNTQIKKVATNRVAGIIQQGQMTGDFRTGDPMLLAKCIHNSLIGMLLSSISENTFVSDTQLFNSLETMVLNFLK